MLDGGCQIRFTWSCLFIVLGLSLFFSLRLLGGFCFKKALGFDGRKALPIRHVAQKGFVWVSWLACRADALFGFPTSVFLLQLACSENLSFLAACSLLKVIWFGGRRSSTGK